jgi:hypothetical protein
MIITLWVFRFKTSDRVPTTSSGFDAPHKRCCVDGKPGLMYNSLVRQQSDQETLPMAMQTHLSELEQRHRALEAELAEALAHPSIDGLQIAELKRRKLQLKDQIARLQNEVSVSVH